MPTYGFSSLTDISRIDRTVNAFERTGPEQIRRHSNVPQLNDRALIGFFNDSGNHVPPFGLLFTKGSKAQTADTKDGPAQGICISVKQPDRYGCQYNCLVADEARGAGYDDQTFGAAQRIPPFIALYETADGTPGFGEAWGPRSGTFKLKKNTGGFRVMGVYDLTNNWALVIPEPMLEFIGMTSVAIPKGNSGTVKIFTGTLGAETDTGQTMTGVWNRFANVAAGKWVRVSWNWTNDQFELIAAEC